MNGPQSARRVDPMPTAVQPQPLQQQPAQLKQKEEQREKAAKLWVQGSLPARATITVIGLIAAITVFVSAALESRTPLRFGYGIWSAYFLCLILQTGWFESQSEKHIPAPWAPLLMKFSACAVICASLVFDGDGDGRFTTCNKLGASLMFTLSSLLYPPRESGAKAVALCGSLLLIANSVDALLGRRKRDASYQPWRTAIPLAMLFFAISILLAHRETSKSMAKGWAAYLQAKEPKPEGELEISPTPASKSRWSRFTLRRRPKSASPQSPSPPSPILQM